MVDVQQSFILGEAAIHNVQPRLAEAQIQNIARRAWQARASMSNQYHPRKPTPSRTAPQNAQTSRILPGQTNLGEQDPHTARGLDASLQQNSTYAAAPSYQSHSIDNWVPEVNSIQQQQHHHHQVNTRSFADGSSSAYTPTASWQDPSFAVVNQHSTSSLAPSFSGRLPQTPAIHISPGYPSYNNSQTPQEQNQATTAYQQSQASQFRGYSTQFLDPQYNMAFEATQQATEMPSPVSPHSGRNSRAVTPIGEPTGRKRAFSEISQSGAQLLDPNAEHAIANAQAGLAIEPPRTQRVSRTIKRSDAPVNDQHKYYCNVSAECANMTFDRKCEWSKHMDKHDRPYRCPHPSCAKLQGFTYSGGLLRHEREVHGKHGGPKAFLMCPHANCKRHTEKGFTRKENLQEHLRRVHSGKEDTTLTVDPGSGAELDTPASGLSGGADVDDMYAAALSKPRRVYDPELDNIPGGRVDELEQQLSVLRQENEEKTRLIDRLQIEAAAQHARLASLEHTIRQLQSGS